MSHLHGTDRKNYHKQIHSALLKLDRESIISKRIKFEERRIGDFSIFHFTKIYSNYCFYVNQTTLLSLPIGLKFRNFIFRLLVAGVPSGIEEKFLSWISLSYIYFDRTKCNDYKCDSFIKNSSETK